MKIVGVEVPVPEEVDSNVLAGEGEGDGKANQDYETTSKGQEIDSPTEEGDDSKVSRTRVHNILCKFGLARTKSHLHALIASANGNTHALEEKRDLHAHSCIVLIYGNGRLDAYDLNRATEVSSFVMFLKAKYPVVIGITTNKWPNLWKKKKRLLHDDAEERRYPQPSSNVLTLSLLHCEIGMLVVVIAFVINEAR